MKLLIITGSLYNYQSGPFESVRQLVISFLKQNFEVDVIGSKDESALDDIPDSYKPYIEKYNNLRVFALNKIGPYNLHYTPSLIKIIKKNNYSYVLLQGVWMWNCWRTFFYCYFKKIPIIISVRGEFNHKKNLKEWKKRIFSPLIKFILIS